MSESGYYARRGPPPSQRAIHHAWLTDLIRQIHTASRGTYGARRVHAELTMGYGVQVDHNAVEMLMSRAGIAGLPGNRRRKRKISGPPTAMDLVDRQFTRAEPDELWVTDIAEHPTREAKVYCAVVLDTFSRRVAGWSIDSSPTATLVTSALGMAINNRNPTDETVTTRITVSVVGFNWLSQHLVMEVVGDDEQASAAAGDSGDAGQDVVAWAAFECAA